MVTQHSKLCNCEHCCEVHRYCDYDTCTERFLPKRPWAKYCSGRCRTRAWRARQRPLYEKRFYTEVPENPETVTTIGNSGEGDTLWIRN